MPHGPSATTCPYRTITSQRKLITSLMMPRFEYYIDLLLSILPPPMQAPHTPSRLSNYHTLGRVFLPYSINYLLRLVNRGQIFSLWPAHQSWQTLTIASHGGLKGTIGWQLWLENHRKIGYHFVLLRLSGQWWQLLEFKLLPLCSL